MGKSITKYRDDYFEPNQRNSERIFNYKPKEGAVETIKNRISDICISLSAKDYLELPELIEDTRYIKLDPKSQKDYYQFEKDMFLQIDEEEIDVTSATALTNKLLQFSNGAVYNENRDVLEVHNSKIEAFLELIEELQGKPVLVFYNFQHDLARIIKATEKLGLKVGILKDSTDIAKWNNKELNILLAHPASAAYGLNLQDGGNHIIWFGLTWSLELYKQANARLHRQGQTQKVIIHHLITENCMDEQVMSAIRQKDVSQNKLLEILKARIKEIKGE